MKRTVANKHFKCATPSPYPSINNGEKRVMTIFINCIIFRLLLITSLQEKRKIFSQADEKIIERILT